MAFIWMSRSNFWGSCHKNK